MTMRILALIIGLLALPSFATAQEAGFAEAACPMELPDTLVEGENIVCGYLTVPENRANPESRTLRLAVVILKAKGDAPQPDPVVYLTGGPGQSATGYEGYWSGYPTIENRDFILIDPRGTGYSEPDMDCSEIEYPLTELPDRAPTVEEINAADLAWSAACRDLVLSRDIDLTAYNTASFSADINDLRLALGLDTVNLYGVSYGAYWALGVLRDYPEGVRSVTLDSVSPPPVDYHAEHGLRAENALQFLFEACAGSAECSAMFPSISDSFYAFAERIREQPFRLPTTELAWLTNTSFIRASYNALYFADRIPILPLALDQVLNEENWEAALQLNRQIGDFGIGAAVYNSVICHDEIAFTNREALAASIETYPYLAGWLASDIANFLNVCEIWGAGQADPVESEPVVSDVPALILTGSFDPTTPPAYGRIAAETLSSSYFFEYPPLAHAVTFFGDCPRNMMAAFVDDPTTEPDSACIASMPPMRFTTDVVINPGIFQMAKNLFLETNIPLVVLVAISAISFIIAGVALPIHWWRTRRQSRDRLAWLQMAASWLLALLYVIFLVVLGVVLNGVMQTSQDVLLFGLPGYAAPVFVILWAALAVLVVTILLTLARWRIMGKSLPVYWAFMAVSLIFTAVLWSWGMFR